MEKKSNVPHIQGNVNSNGSFYQNHGTIELGRIKLILVLARYMLLQQHSQQKM